MNRTNRTLQFLVVVIIQLTTINLIAQNPLVCDFRPTALQSSAITTNSAILTWNDPNNAGMWELEVRPKNVAFTSPNYTATSNPFTVTGLNPGVEYKYRVRSVCAGGVLSNWSINPHLFITVLSNPSTCQLKLDIPDNSCSLGYKNFEIEVQGVSGAAMGTDVILKEVRLIVAHSWIRDIEVNLVSPNNKSIRLTKENGGSNDNYGDPSDNTCTKTTVFTEGDCTAKSIKEGNAPFIGNFYPEESFSYLYDGTNPNGKWTLRICDAAGGDIGSLEYVQLVFLPTNCTAPFNIETFGITYNSAFIEWNSTGPCNKSIVEIGPKGFTPGTGETPGANGTIFTLNCPSTGPLQLTGLNELMDYDVYIRKDCGGGNFSVNSCVKSFTTFCNHVGAITIAETFDNNAVCNSCNCGEGSSISGVFESSPDGDFDWLVRNGPTPSGALLTGPDGDINGSGKYIYLETSGTSCQNKKAILQSGCIKVSAASQDTCHMSFFYHMRGATINKLQVFLTENGGATWQLIWSATGNKGKDWLRAYLDLSDWHNKNVQFRFVGFSGNGGTGDIALDQIEFYGSIFQGEATNVYYADKDGDGFGDPLSSIKTCNTIAPNGFTADNNDCNDNNNLIKPGGAEVSCNGIDENCNGLADDKILINPIVSGQNTCEGSPDTLTVISPLKGSAYWFTSPTSKQPVFVGNPFITPVINANTVYFVMDSSTTFGCYSQKVPVNILVFKEPLLVTNDMPRICRGNSFNLANINVNDLKNAGGVLSFHTGFPPTNLNKLSNTTVSPLSTAQYYIRSLNANGCDDVLPVLLVVDPVPSINIQNLDPIQVCPAAAVTLVSSASGGTFPYTYLWNNGSPEFSTTVYGSVVPGSQNYTVTVTDFNKCKAVDTITVNTAAGISNVVVNVTDVTTCLGDNGSVFLAPSGTGPYNYYWSGPVSGSFTNIPGNVTIMNLKKGSYSITVTQTGASCDYIIPVVVVNGPGVQLLNTKVTDISCAGQSDGKIELTVLGSNLNFQWNSGENTKDIFNKVAGFYSVLISDGLCDLEIKNIQIKTPTSLAASGIPTSPSCFGLNSGSLNLYITGGTQPYSFKWSNGDTLKNISGLNAGNYVCTITDVNNCKIVTPVYQLFNPPSMQVFTIKDDVDCYFGSDGVISVSALGGLPPYSFKWSDGLTVKDRNFLNAGSYKLTITDQNGCSTTTSNINILQPDPLQVSINSIVQSSCKNLANGLIDINVVGGTPPYEYLWSNNYQNEDLINASKGVYGVTVTDAKNCRTGAGDLAVLSGDSISVSLASSVNTVCNTLSNGSISINVTGGNGNYNYAWSNTSSTKNLNGIPSGNYQVTVSDNNGCAEVSKVFKILEISPLTINLENLEIADCSTNQKGNIDISVKGKSPYNYAWSNGATTEDLFNVFNGQYSVTVTDNLGCKASLPNIQLSGNGDPFFVYLDVLGKIKCPGDLNGKLIVQIDGGAAPFQYNWSIGKEYDLQAQIDSITGLPAGQYEVTITDSRGCVVSDTVSLNSPQPLILNVKNIKNLACKGKSTGSINLEITGGTKPYKFIWSTPNGLVIDYDPIFENLESGYYSVTVEDANGCLSILAEPVFLNEPPVAFEFDNIFVTQPGCAGSASGSISVITKGGIGLTNYAWNPPIVVGSFGTGLSGGTYKITVTDQNNCAIDTTIVLVPYQPMKVAASVMDDPVCNSKNNFIFLAVSQGQPPYQYTWNTGATSSYLDSLYAGTYLVQIKDAKGCIYKDTFNVGVKGMNLDSIISSPNNGIPPNGFASVYVSGGLPPYKYLWDAKAGGGTEQSVGNLIEGYYCVLVEDQNDCKLTVCVEIENKVGTANLYPNEKHANIFPNPATESIQIKDFENFSGKGRVMIFDAVSHKILETIIFWQNGLSADIEISSLVSGVYWVTYEQNKKIKHLMFIKI